MDEKMIGEEMETELMYRIAEDKGEEDMDKIIESIKELDVEIEALCQTINDAEGALDAAEKERDGLFAQLEV